MWRAPRLCFSVVTSFTFFGELQFLNLDREWRQAEANQARAIFDETKRHVREMVTAAWIDAEVRQLDPDTQNAFALFFRNVAHSSNSTVTSWAVAEKLAKTAPSVSVANEKKLGPDGLVSEPAQAMLASTDSIDGALPENRPSLAALRAVKEEFPTAELRMRTSRDAAIDFASDAFASFVPASDQKLVKLFVRALAFALSRAALENVVPANVADVDATKSWAKAKSWVKTHVYQSADKMTQAWKFSVDPLKEGAEAAVKGSSEALVKRRVERFQFELANPKGKIYVKKIPFIRVLNPCRLGQQGA